MLVLNQHWLQSWLEGAKIDACEAHDFLLQQGFEMEPCDPLHTQAIVVGQIMQVEKHPDADRLNVCQVDVGQKALLSIVCGCASVRAGLKVAVAPVGTNLGAFNIEKRKLRGVDSCGMLCSMAELGFKTQQDGIWHLSPEAVVGEPLNRWLQREEARYGIELTPNRGDCMSLRGMAREFAIGMGCTMRMPWRHEDEMTKLVRRGDVEVSAEARSHVKACYVLKLEREDALRLSQTPDWMKVRLLEAGFSLHHPVVDILNYSMLETGQPFHAYGGHLTDNFSLTMGAQEKIALLNATDAVLDKHTLVVKNDDQPVCIAGYMGGQSSASCEDDSTIYLEAASFSSATVAYHCRRYAHHTQSGSRFERGTDSEFTLAALQRALQLLRKYTGLTARYYMDYVSAEVSEPVELTFAESFPARILGVEVSASQVLEAVRRSSCLGRRENGVVTITVPSWRNDLRHPECIVSEYVRLAGLPDFRQEALAAVLPRGVKEFEHADWLYAQLHASMTGWGFNETYSLSFDNEAEASVFVARQEALVLLENPISQSLQVMRPSLLAGLLRQVKKNLAKQECDVQLYEVGKCFKRGSNGLQETSMLGAVLTGRAEPENWLSASTYGFAHAKSLLTALLRKTLGTLPALDWKAEVVPGMHPYQSGSFYCGGQLVGSCGLLHPAVAKRHKLAQAIYFITLDLDWLSQQSLRQSYLPVSDQPTMRRDLSLLVPSTVTYAEIKCEIQSSVFQYLKKIVIFDTYEGAQVPEGFYGLSIGLLFQDDAKTLQDDDLHPMLADLIEKLDKKLMIKPRGGSFNGNTNKS